MMPTFEYDVDFNHNQLIKVVLEKLNQHPQDTKNGRIYYNESNEKIWYKTPDKWCVVGKINELTSNNGSVNIEVDPNDDSIVNIEINPDNATLGINQDGEIYILDNGVDTQHIKDDAITTIKIVDKAITFSKLQDLPSMTIIGNLSDSSSSPNAIQIIKDENLIGGDHTNIPTTGAVIAYVNSAISNLGMLIGGWDASTGVFPSNLVFGKGDYWYVTGSGTINNVIYDIGDIIVASINNPQTQGDFLHLKIARGQATTTSLGFVRLSTDQMALDMIDTESALTPSNLGALKANSTEIFDENIDNKFVTPKMVHLLFDSYFGKYSLTFGDGTTTNFTIVHNLGTKDIDFDLFIDSNNTKVHCSALNRTINSFEFIFKVPPRLNEYRVNVWE